MLMNKNILMLKYFIFHFEEVKSVIQLQKPLRPFGELKLPTQKNHGQEPSYAIWRVRNLHSGITTSLSPQLAPHVWHSCLHYQFTDIILKLTAELPQRPTKSFYIIVEGRNMNGVTKLQ